MSPTTVFEAIAHSRHSFVEASLLCALLELGAADGPSKTTGRTLQRRNLPEAALSKSALHRLQARLVAEGVLSVSVYKNTRTSYAVSIPWLDGVLDAGARSEDESKARRLVGAMHRLRDYDAALLLVRLSELPADELGAVKLSGLIEPFGESMDRHRARRALYRLASAGLVALAPKDRSGLGITLSAEAVAGFLAQPLPDLRYLNADAYSSQPYFIARAARLASATADAQSVELGAAELVISDVQSQTGLPVSAPHAGVIGDAVSTSLST